MIKIGQYREIYNDSNMPLMSDFINDVPMKNRDKIIKYLSQHPKWISPSICTDVFTGELIDDSIGYVTDGVYGWRTDLSHYVKKYNLNLPDDFIQHILSK